MYSQILSNLSPADPWRDRIHWFDTIDSTNTRAKELAAQGAPHGTVLIADQQTGGRGRMGRSFCSPGGVGIYMSVILRPQCLPQQLMHLTCAAAVAMCGAVENAVGLRPQVKWTNDLVAGKRKIAGILTELGLNGTKNVDYAVVGVGINCCQSREDFPPEIRDIAASLHMVTGKDIDRAKLAAAMILAFRQMDAHLAEKAAILEQYRRDCITIGQQVSVLRPGTVSHGKAVDVDDEGALAVLFPDGHCEHVNSGEVSIRGMYGYL